jgi:hypothetical protein
MKMAAFRDVAPCWLVDIDQRFRERTASINTLKRRLISTRLHSTASQKRVIFS